MASLTIEGMATIPCLLKLCSRVVISPISSHNTRVIRRPKVGTDRPTTKNHRLIEHSSKSPGHKPRKSAESQLSVTLSDCRLRRRSTGRRSTAANSEFRIVRPSGGRSSARSARSARCAGFNESRPPSLSPR